MTGITTVRARVTGRVQGVAYRAWTRDEATRLGLSGWVGNEPDGTVSALLSGPADAVERMLAAMWSGPPHASVRSVEARPTDGPPPHSFEIRR